jgi:ketosteroid isomerase-like protein
MINRSPQPKGAQYHDAGAEVRDAIAAAFDRCDAPGVAAFYTYDAQLLPPNSGFLVGKPAIQAFWQTFMDMGIKLSAVGHGDQNRRGGLE